MNILRLSIFALTATLFIACGSDKKEKISGKWKLTGYSDESGKIELKACDKQTVWNFTTTPAEALGDGTAVQKLEAVAPEDCKFFGFDSKWTIKDGKLFVSTSRIGGMGGFSHAGTMEITELTDAKLVLKTMKNTIIFEK